MKKSLTALALALALAGTLAACSTDRNPGGNNSGTAGNNSGTAGTTSGTNGGTVSGSAGGSVSGTPGTVSRSYGGQSVYNGSAYGGRDYFEDGRYTAGSNGQVYSRDNGTVSRDLTQGARDIVRGTEDVLDDMGRGIGNAARDITGNGYYSGTPSWEPDSSAVRY